MLKVDSGGSVGGDDDLQLVVVSVRAGSNLDSLLELVRSTYPSPSVPISSDERATLTEHIVAHLTGRLGPCVVEADDKESLVEHIETHGVPWLLHQARAVTSPDGSSLGGEDSQGRLGDLVLGSAVGVGDDRSEVGEEGALGEAGSVTRVEYLHRDIGVSCKKRKEEEEDSRRTSRIDLDGRQ